MIMLHSKKGPRALRKNKGWDEAYKNSLTNNYYKKRNEKYVLMNPKKRRILFKMLAMKDLMKVKRRDSDDSLEYSAEDSAEHSSQCGTGSDDEVEGVFFQSKYMDTCSCVNGYKNSPRFISNIKYSYVPLP